MDRRSFLALAPLAALASAFRKPEPVKPEEWTEVRRAGDIEVDARLLDLDAERYVHLTTISNSTGSLMHTTTNAVPTSWHYTL